MSKFMMSVPQKCNGRRKRWHDESVRGTEWEVSGFLKVEELHDGSTSVGGTH